MVAELLPGTARTTEEYIEGSGTGPSDIYKITIGYDSDNTLLGYVITASSPGYAGPVEIMAAFSPYGVLTGVQVLSQRETPGLGTAILNEDFLAQFSGRTEAMTVSRLPSGENEIAALASATISTSAVVNGINAALDYMAQQVVNRDS